MKYVNQLAPNQLPMFYVEKLEAETKNYAQVLNRKQGQHRHYDQITSLETDALSAQDTKFPDCHYKESCAQNVTDSTEYYRMS